MRPIVTVSQKKQVISKRVDEEHIFRALFLYERHDS